MRLIKHPGFIHRYGILGLVAWAIAGCAASSVAVRSAADPQPSGFAMSVARLLEHAQGQPVTPLPPSVSNAMRKSLARDQVRMFIAGVIDSGEGRRWCVGGSGQSRTDVDQWLLDVLARDRVPNIPAATAIAGQLQRRFPCPTTATAARDEPLLRN
ncbi:hypothetical protein G3580_07235 [Nitrogeniibacter mangrovi]|uniref:Rap1a immunity protein domain-containing protein n=1 Tax=Nitrogeniibacter mangrovi TaxID=2016596 RepID=A0A6C1B1F2_9RHOO|nr:Rap1a/Tai family immunity protein [Nitrogeniibacter mangrovi]QID17456.1 hypothetical protein G3580_07235 [Nitrogeniibacter mangrovi]